MAVSVSIVPMTGMHQPYLLLENIDHFTQMFGKDITLRYVGYRVDVLVLVGELDIYTAKKKVTVSAMGTYRTALWHVPLIVGKIVFELSQNPCDNGLWRDSIILVIPGTLLALHVAP